MKKVKVKNFSFRAFTKIKIGGNEDIFVRKLGREI